MDLESTVHIVYASDDRFAEILGVSLVSLYENSGDMENIVVYILDSGISDENKERIDSLCHAYDRQTPVWIKATDVSEQLGMNVSVDRGSLSQYARLFVSSDLPDNLQRVLYLDCDIILLKSVRELWNLDMKGKTIAALKDAFSKYYRSNIGLQQDDAMFNSGVMLIDLKRWKEQNVEKNLLEFIAKKKGVIQQGDQGALNAILSKDTYCFEPKFNAVTIFFDFTYKELIKYRKPAEGYYAEKEIEAAKNGPSIVHFTTSFASKRPWVKGCEHCFASEWLHYRSLSPWKDYPLWEDNRSGAKKFIMNLFNALPRGVAIPIAGFFQAYARPLIYKMKN